MVESGDRDEVVVFVDSESLRTLASDFYSERGAKLGPIRIGDRQREQTVAGHHSLLHHGRHVAVGEHRRVVVHVVHVDQHRHHRFLRRFPSVACLHFEAVIGILKPLLHSC